jgi:hypothetical protein
MRHRRGLTLETMGHAWCDKTVCIKLDFFDYLLSKKAF